VHDEEGRSNHGRVELVKEALKKRGVKAWIDSDKMRSSIRPCISDALDTSMGIIYFVTKKYQEKVNSIEKTDDCHFEFTASCSHKVLANNRYVVVMEKFMLVKNSINNWEGLLRNEIGKDLYFNMSEDDLIESECDKMVKWMEEVWTER
jgi:5S rRNA maturation endonuclease (ribonuclease M5)